MAFEGEEHGDQHDAGKQGDRDPRPYRLVRVLGVVAPLADVEVGGASVAETPSKRLRDDKYRKHDARRGVAEGGQFAVADKDLVDDVVERADQKGKNAGNRKLDDEFGDLFGAQKLGRCV